MTLSVVVLVVTAALELYSAPRILMVFPIPSRSHYILGGRPIEELIKKGHEVTILSQFRKPEPLKNLTGIVPNVFEELSGPSKIPRWSKRSRLHQHGLEPENDELPKTKLEGILKDLSKLKQKVLWTFESESKNFPKNMKISKWLPESDILGMKLWLVALVLAAALEVSSASSILIVIPSPSRSHYNLGDRLSEELIKKGHEVTIVASFRKSKPLKNLTEIIIPDVSKAIFEAIPQEEDGKFAMRHISPLVFFTFIEMGKSLVDFVLTEPSVQELLHSNKKFDLIVGECFLVEGLLAGFSYWFKAPIAAIATFMPNLWTNEIIGNPYPASYVPDPILGYTDKMNFQERLYNFLYTTLAQAHHYLRHLPGQDAAMRKHLGKNMPYIQDILSKTSLVLVNHHYSLAFPRPYLPNMVEVGSYHVKPPKPLPQDLQKYLDDAKEGVVYFSMGSNLESDELPKAKLDGILKDLSKLKQKVLWKFESENINLPKNVKISKWLPQSDILAHPNVKLFITHGGLLSFTESVLRGVPVVGIPVFGDQPLNVKYVQRMDLGVKVDYEDLGKDGVLYNAVQEVLNNPKYTNNVKSRSVLLQDLPMSTIDTAIYWLEYVIRYNGAPHLISGAQELTWYQLYLLDVYAFIGAVTFVVGYVLCKIFCYVSRTVCRKKNKKMSPRKKKN